MTVKTDPVLLVFLQVLLCFPLKHDGVNGLYDCLLMEPTAGRLQTINELHRKPSGPEITSADGIYANVFA